MFYVIKDEKLHEYGNRLSKAWDFPAEAKELEGVTVDEYEFNKYKYKVQNGCLVDISTTPEYLEKVQNEAKQKKVDEIKRKLTELDLKSIRALREGGVDKEGAAYLEKYQNEIDTLRAELQKIQ